MKGLDLKLVYAYDHPAEVVELFREYTDMLIEGDSRFAEYLEIQNYDQELEDLTVKYGMPDGRLYLLYREGQPAGCVGLKKLNEKECELKRLYVRPQFRGEKLGEYLMDVIIKDAGEIGYSAMLLDTLPFLENACGLYQKLGFYEIPAYNDSPLDTSIYMKLDL